MTALLCTVTSPINSSKVLIYSFDLVRLRRDHQSSLAHCHLPSLFALPSQARFSQDPSSAHFLRLVKKRNKKNTHTYNKL